MRLCRSDGKIPCSFISLSVLRLSVISRALVLPILYNSLTIGWRTLHRGGFLVETNKSTTECLGQQSHRSI